jgi:hypothetical protein
VKLAFSLAKRRKRKLEQDAEWRTATQIISSSSSMASTRPSSVINSPIDGSSAEKVVKPEIPFCWVSVVTGCFLQVEKVTCQVTKAPSSVFAVSEAEDSPQGDRVRTSLKTRGEAIRYIMKKHPSPLKKERERILKKYSPIKRFKRRLILKSSGMTSLDRESHEIHLTEKEKDETLVRFRKWSSRGSEDEARHDSDGAAEEEGEANDADDDHEKDDLDEEAGSRDRSPSQCAANDADAEERLRVRDQEGTSNILHKKRKRYCSA